MNIKALFFSSLPSECIHHFWPESSESWTFSLFVITKKTTVQQHGRTKSKKGTWAEFISRSGQGSATWLYVSNVSSFQDQTRVQQCGRMWATWVHFKIRPGFNNVAVPSLKRRFAWAEFISRSGQDSAMWVHFKIRPGFNNVAVRSLKRLPELSSFQDQARVQQRGHTFFIKYFFFG